MWDRPDRGSYVGLRRWPAFRRCCRMKLLQNRFHCPLLREIWLTRNVEMTLLQNKFEQFWPLLISPRRYKRSFPDANSKDKVTFFVPWTRAAECNFAYITENPEMVLFVHMQDNVPHSGFTPYFNLLFLNNLTWNNNLEILLSFQSEAACFITIRRNISPKLQEMWSGWSFSSCRTFALMTSSWLLNLKCLLFLLEWHVIFWWLNNWYIMYLLFSYILKAGKLSKRLKRM